MMEDRRTMEARRDIERFENDTWSLGTLIAVVVACFVVLGVVIYMFGDESATQTAANNSPPRSERMMKAPQAPATEPSTTGQRASP